jgi:signal transduction histidine kinase
VPPGAVVATVVAGIALATAVALLVALLARGRAAPDRAGRAGRGDRVAGGGRTDRGGRRDRVDGAGEVRRTDRDAPPPRPGAPAANSGDVATIARRTLVLLGRQLAVVDSLERDELDPDTLRTLYRLDHLATRMRRYAESLLVLVGEDVGRQARAPMPLSDVVRTATSGIEQYPRIDVTIGEPDAEPLLAAHRALPAAHLLAELLDNAAAASDPQTPVRVTAGRTADGVRVTVADAGIGMTDDEIAAALAVVRDPGGERAAGSARLGLHVVGRLARRLGAEVRIAPGDPAGIVVDVDLPADVLVPDEAPPPAPEPVAAEPVAEPVAAEPVAAVRVAPVATAARAGGRSPAARPPLPVRPPLPRRRDLRVVAPAPAAEPAAATTGWVPFASAPAADILPAGRDRRPRRWGPDPAPSPRAAVVAATPPPGEPAEDLGRRSALASEALSELSMLSSYRPQSAPGGPPLQHRQPAEVPPPVPPPILAPVPRDPAAAGGLLAGFAAGARRGRAEESRAANAPVPAPIPASAPDASGWRIRPTTEERR